MPPLTIKLQDRNDLVFEDGDVIIRTGDDQSSVFLVHSDILKRKSSWFAALLSSRWSRPSGAPINKVSHTPPEYHTDTSILEKKKWLACDSDSAFRSLLGTQWPIGNVRKIPRLQFEYNEEQPTTFTPFYFDDHNKVYREEVPGCRLPSYAAFTLGYSSKIPLLHRDQMYAKWREPQVGHPTHKQAQRHLGLVWRVLLLCLYGKTKSLPTGMSLRRKVRLIASVAVLAIYHGALEAVKALLTNWLLESPEIWKAIPEDLAFFLVLAYHLRCASVFLDAVKHFVGSSVGGDSTKRTMGPALTWSDRLRAVNLSSVPSCDQLTFPKQIISFVLEASSSMQMSMTDFKRDLLYQLDASVYVSAVCLRGVDNIARMTLAQHISHGPASWKQLWLCKESDDVEVVRRELSPVRIGGTLTLGLKHATVMLKLLKHDDISALLDDYMGTSGAQDCYHCSATFIIDPLYTGRQESRVGVSGPLCYKHGHNTKHHTGEYFTTLHDWHSASELEDTNEDYWPPPGDEYHPGEPLPAVEVTPTQPASFGTLTLLGLGAIFTQDVTAEQVKKHNVRQASRCGTGEDKDSETLSNIAAMLDGTLVVELDLTGRVLPDWTAYFSA